MNASLANFQSRSITGRIGRIGTALSMLAAGGCLSVPALAADAKFVFLSNWFAEAEHGGFYQAIATGLYQQAGLDVTMKMGGPQVNTMQLLAAGQADCMMASSDTQVLNAREAGVPAVTIAAVFQKDPQGFTAHPGVKRIEDLKSKTLLLGAAARTTYWPWLKAKYGFTDAQTRPYNYNLQPFIADDNIVVQGYVTSDPYMVETQAHFKPSFFLFSDYGWPNYSTTVVCLEKTLKERPNEVAAFIKASMQGWKSYLSGDPKAAHALIVKDNPNMTEGQMAAADAAMKERGLVMGGDAATMGIGVITPARLQKTYDTMVGLKLLDGGKVDLQKSYTTRFIDEAKILP